MIASLIKSPKQGKRLRAVFKDGTHTDFGQAGGSTYIDHQDKAKRAAYIARHQVRENFNDPKTAGALSRWILWGDHTTLEANLKAFNTRFKH